MEQTHLDDMLDCLIVGAGPGGLVAAIYLARFRRKVRVIDAGHSRASLIPVSHNYPGFPGGISGNDLLQRLRQQALTYCSDIRSGTVQDIERIGNEGFVVQADGETCRAKNVILATGVVDIEPDLPNQKDAIQQGYVRHCPICDGYEVIDRKVAVIGHGKEGIREALFLRQFTADLTLLTLGKEMALTEDERHLLQEANIEAIEEPIAEVTVENGRIAALRARSGKTHTFDTLYSALGARARADLALRLGAKCKEGGELFVDEHYQTSIDGLYAVGDVASGLNQICVATAHAAIAATAIHNDLQSKSGRRI